MTQKRSPDGRLVYLHCSSIFSGANAEVRKAKKVSQLLQKHKASIKILTKEFTLPAIAAIAKELLEERIFESLPRAKLRYPELFQPSETQEAERAASEAEVVRIEAEAAHDIVLTSDDEGGDECLDVGESQQRAEPEGTLEDRVEAPDNVQTSAVELWQVKQSTSQAQQALSIPRLHPVYLPFRTQHKTLVLTQRLLEECCLEFGNTWVPDLMEARQWHEVESIELTEWTKRFLKYAKSLPPSAIKRTSGKSIAEVLFGTSSLRHSAVHRLPTSAAGILNMLHAAMTFAEALHDSKRAEKVAEIRTQLEASIEEIVQHQNLLERKLKDQLEDISRRRAELDQLERSSIEEMLATDKEQRTVVGSALESFLVGSQQISNSCACNHTPGFDGAKADSEAEENIESSGTEHEQNLPETVDDTQACDQRPLDVETPYHGEKMEKGTGLPWHDNNDDGVEEEPEVSRLIFSKEAKKKKKKGAASLCDFPAVEEHEQKLPETVNDAQACDQSPLDKGEPHHGKELEEDIQDPWEVSEVTFSKKDKKKKKKGAASRWGISAFEEPPVLVDEAPAPAEVSPAPEHVYWKSPRYGAWNFGATRDVHAEPQHAVGESFPTEEPCPVAPEEASHTDESYNVVPVEEPEPGDIFPTQEPVYSEEPMETKCACPDVTLEPSQAELVIDDYDDAEKPIVNQHDNISRGLNDPYESASVPDVAPTHSPPAEDAEFLVPAPKPALTAVRDQFTFRPPLPSAPSSTKTSVFEARAAALEEAPTEDSHTITLKILHGSKVLRSIVFIKACTRTAILKEARAYCVKCARDDQGLATLLATGYDLALLSMKMYGYDTDLSTYKVENLSSLVRAIEKTGIPRFTLRISEV